MSRHAALKALRRVDIARQLAIDGIIVRAERPSLPAEEASLAYKDVTDVVRVAEAARQLRRVARLRPLVVIKG
jgi:tRNA-splicing ligase RtcB